MGLTPDEQERVDECRERQLQELADQEQQPARFRRFSRRRVTREELESRLSLHHSTVTAVLDRLAAQASDSDLATELANLTTWIVADRERLLQDLFHRVRINPGRRGRSAPAP